MLHVSDKQKGMLPETNKEYYYNLLYKYVANDNIFFSQNQPSIQADYCFETNLREVANNKNMDFYCLSSENNDADMFERLLAEVSSTKNISFCSNVYNLKMLEDGKYKYFTSNPNTIQRVVKKEEEEKKAGEALLREEEQGQNNKKESKKKDDLKVVYAIIAVILLVVITLIILL